MHLGLNKIPSPVRGIQCATQAAIESFASCLRQEMRPRGVDVSIVAAGEFSPGNGWLNETELRDQVNNCPWYPSKKTENDLLLQTIIVCIVE